MKKKGFTLIELVVVVAIIGLLAAFGTLKMSGRAEKNALVKFKGKAPEFIRVSAQRAFEEGEDYIIEINTTDKVIRRKEEISSTTSDEEIFLPEILNYEIYDTSDGTTDDSITIKVDDVGQGWIYTGGNFIDGFNKDIFVFTKKDEAIYRMKLFSDNPVKYLRIQTSLPIGVVERSNYDTNIGLEDEDDDNWEVE